MFNVSALSLLGEELATGKIGSAFEFRSALRPHLSKLLPRILRACHDPNKQTREQMAILWTGITGGGAEGRLAITQHLTSTIDSLLVDTSSKFWRPRVGSCGALSEVIVGRDWNSLGGGGAILNDDDLVTTRVVTAGIRLLRIWNAATRSLDDVHGAVRDIGETLARAARALTIRLCDPSIDPQQDGPTLGRGVRENHERDATAAAATSLRWLIHHGLKQTCAEATGACISTLVDVVGVVRPKILEPTLPTLLSSLLLAMSALEPAALNYLQLRTSDQEGVERVRLQLAQSGPFAVATSKCLELVPLVQLSTQQRVAPELNAALRKSAGFATRAAIADAISTLCRTCPSAFQFPGLGNVNPSVQLLRAFFVASEQERGNAAKDKMVHAIGNLAAHCPGSSVRSLALRACRRYVASTGNNFDTASRRSAAAALHAIALRASTHFSDGGAGDIWAARVLPVAFLGRKDSDPKVAALWQVVWDEGGAAASLSDSSPSMNNFGTVLEEKLLMSVVKECTSALRDVSWSRRISGAQALIDLCHIGILCPCARSTQPSGKADAVSLLRSRNRSEASHLALVECVRLLAKPRLWKGKVDVMNAATQIATKWASAEATSESKTALYGWNNDGDACPWRPLAMKVGYYKNDLFAGDSWFVAPDAMDDFSPEPSLETPILDSSEKDDRGDVSLLNFGQVDVMDTDEDIVTSPESSQIHDTVTLTGLCRFLLTQGMSSSTIQNSETSEDMLPYRLSACRCFRDLISSLPQHCVEHRIEVFKIVSPVLLQTLLQDNAGKGIDMRESPVLLAGAINCVEACFWKDIGSTANGQLNDQTKNKSNDAIDIVNLISAFRTVSGPGQPAWTVREAAVLCLAQLAYLCDEVSIRRHAVLAALIAAAQQSLTDRKFGRVRYVTKTRLYIYIYLFIHTPSKHFLIPSVVVCPSFPPKHCWYENHRPLDLSSYCFLE